MENCVWKICLIVAFTITGVLSRDACVLIYEKDVPDKPDIILLTEGNRELSPAICRIRSSELMSTRNYFVQHRTYYSPPLNTRRSSTCRRRSGSSPRSSQCRKTIVYNRVSDPKTFRRVRNELARFRSLRYDASEQSILYFSSEHRFGIIKQNLRDLKPVPVRFANTKITFTSRDFAYDWITKNVYINGDRRISVVNLKNPDRTTEIISNRKENINLRVHPNKGYLFFMDSKRKSHSFKISHLNYAIFRANLDGSNVTRISEFFNETMYGLTIDYYSDRLYWSIPSSKIIQHSKLDGTDVKNISCESYGTIAFDKNYIYYVDGKTDSIVRRKKLENEDDNDFRINSVQDSLIEDFMINDSGSQQIRKDHPCLLNNGDCQQFCFAVPESDDKLKRVCACKTEHELEADLVSCAPVKKVTSSECNNSTTSRPSN